MIADTLPPPANGKTFESRFPLAGQLVVITVVILFLFFPALSFKLSLDDQFHVLPALTLNDAWTTPTWPGNLYRPFFLSTIIASNSIIGPSLLALHAENILLHIVVSLLVLIVARSIVTSRQAFLLALLFAAFPVHTEVIANISFRTESLCAMLVLTSLILTERQRQRPRRVFALLIFTLVLLAACSKESGILTAPLIALLIYFKAGTTGLRTHFLYSIAPAIVGVIAYLAVRVIILNSTGPTEILILDNFLAVLPTLKRIAYALPLLTDYLAITVFGSPLAVDYSYPKLNAAHLSLGEAILTSLLMLLLATICITRAQKRDALWFWCGWFAVSFALTANILFPIGTAFGERLIYLPSVAVAGVLALLLTNVRDSLQLLCMTALVGMYATAIILYLPAWRDDSTLWLSELKRSPNSIRVQQSVAAVYMRQKKYDEALPYAKQALALSPQFTPSVMALQNLYQMRGEYQTAYETMLPIIEKSKEETGIAATFGWLLLRLSRPEEAQKCLVQSIRLNPDDLYAQAGYALSLLATQPVDGAKAIENLPAGLKTDPDFQSLQQQLLTPKH